MVRGDDTEQDRQHEGALINFLDSLMLDLFASAPIVNFASTFTAEARKNAEAIRNCNIDYCGFFI